MKGLFNFASTYSGYGGKSYITFSIPATEKLKKYQTDMLAKNPIDFLLPLSVQRLNNNWKLSYEITSKIPLGKILERKKLKYEEFEQIINQIGRLSVKLKDYLLDITSVILDKSYIYCDPADLSLYLLYFPVEIKEYNYITMKDFLQTLIVEDIHLLDDSSGSLLKRLLDVLKSETFTPEQLLECIKSKPLNEQSGMYQSSKESNEVNFQTKQNTPAHIKEFAEQKKKPNTMDVFKKSDINNKIANLKYPFQSYLIASTVNIALISTLIYILFTNSGTKDLKTVLGLFLIGFAINYFIFTRLFSENKKINSKEEWSIRTEKSPVSKRFVNEEVEEDIILPKMASLNNRPLFISYEETEVGNVDETEIKPIRNERICGNLQNETFESFVEDAYSFDERTKNGIAAESNIYVQLENNKFVSDKTVILGYASDNIPYLQSHSLPSEKISITKVSMLLGRLTDSVDYTIQNRAVGKIHAEIVKRDDGYYVIDLNSVNGTYINNERIICNTEVKLENGDIITLANESYTFIV